ncbi:MAG: hypothetical protein L0322_24980 [Chloroflexi bacterium]|nr:hypothetical protein [Chloroflexota bacterium]
MDPKYLFGAEVNQIQETLFGSSLQRQVVGGSRLLATFSEEAANIAKGEYGAEKKLVSAGGSFRLVFGQEAQAAAFGRYLADAYHLLLDGMLTTVPPQLFDAAKESCFQGQEQCQDLEAKCFKCADDALSRKIEAIKQGQSVSSRLAAGAVAQAPTTAFCQLSGVGLADRHTGLFQRSEPPKHYMSAVAFRMKEVGFVIKPGDKRKEPRDDTFLGPIREKIITTEDQPQREWARRPEDMAYWDPAQGNVAYLIADGNNMGQYFSLCRTEKQKKDLSELVDEAVRQAIAAPIARLIDCLWASSRVKQEKEEQEIPVLPLIAAGDDIFMLLPAPYALDYARRFCLAFEAAMNHASIMRELNAEPPGGLAPIRMSAAIVICKQKYPYHLAHHYGKALLAQSKQVAKTAGRASNQWLSAVSLGLIIGSEVREANRYQGRYRPGLTSYWAINEGTELEPTNQAVTLDLKNLLDNRLWLQKLPSKRRAEIRELFHHPPENKDDLGRWNKRLHKLLRRLEITSPDSGFHSLLQDSLAILGDPDGDGPAYWRRIHRSGSEYYAHGLPDLLTIWPYAQSLDEDLDRYEEERDA